MLLQTIITVLAVLAIVLAYRRLGTVLPIEGSLVHRFRQRVKYVIAYARMQFRLAALRTEWGTNYYRRGKTKIWLVPGTTVATTAVAVGAGTNITKGIAEMNGFSSTNTPIPTPDMDSEFTTSVPGEDTAEDSSLVYYEDDTTNPFQDLMARRSKMVLYIFYGGLAGTTPAAGDKCEIWPVMSTGPARTYSVGNDPAQWRCGFNPTAVPVFDQTLT